MLLIQYRDAAHQRRVGILEQDRITAIDGFASTLELAQRAIDSATPLEQLARDHAAANANANANSGAADSYAAVLAEGRLIAPGDLGLENVQAPISAGLDESRLRAERDAILASLARSGGNVTHAARELAISRMTLYRQMAKHGIDAP